MYKTFSINLAGQIFHINEDAFELLSGYLKSLKETYNKEEGGDEIMSDIEARISEILLNENKNDSKKIIEKHQVEHIIQMLGRPEQHFDAPEDEEPKNFYSRQKTQRKMFRDSSQQKVAGVCAGLSQYLGINDPIWLRLLFVISVIAGFGSGILIYIVLWILLPEATTASEKLQMKGEPINLENIEKTIKDGINNVSNTFNNIDSKETIRNTTNGLGSFFVDLLKGLLKIVKAFLLVILVLFTVILVSLLFSAGVGSLAVAPALSSLIFESSILAYITVIAFVVLMIVTSLFLILLPFQLFSSNKKPLKRPVGITIGILWIGTFLIALIGSADAFRHFSAQKKIHNEEVIAAGLTNDTIYITTNKYEGPVDENSNVGIHWNNWKIVNSGIYNGMVKLNIAQSPDQDIHIFEELSARGATQNAAANNVRNIDYQYSKAGDTLIFNDFIDSKKPNSKFRVQQVEITLYIPEGKVIQFDDVQDIINKKPRIKNFDTDVDYSLETTIWKIENGFLVPLTGDVSVRASTKSWADVTPSGNFSEIDISGFIESEIIYAPETKVLVNQSNDIKVQTIGNKLQVDMKKGTFNIHPGKEAFKVKIYTPSASRVASSGLTNTIISGFQQNDIELQIEGSSTISLNNNTFKNLDAVIEGVSVLKGFSNTDNAEIDVEGMSRYEGENILIKKLQLNVDGNSQAAVNVSETIKGNLSGLSKLYYSGNPSLDVTTNGSSDVQRR